MEEALSSQQYTYWKLKTGKGLLYVSLLFGAKREKASLWPCIVPRHPAGWLPGGTFRKE